MINLIVFNLISVYYYWEMNGTSSVYETFDISSVAVRSHGRKSVHSSAERSAKYCMVIRN